MDLRRVVITGLGALTPLGNDPQSFWEGMCEGKSGAGRAREEEAPLLQRPRMRLRAL